MEQILLEIIDDPANIRVFKGPGHFAATRAESVIRKLEAAFPTLRFEIFVDGNLSKLKATAVVRSEISPEEFIGALKDALTSTGTRVSPLGETAIRLERDRGIIS
jgi:hypothetical protein